MAFGDFVNLFAGGSCSYAVDEGEGMEGSAFIFAPILLMNSHTKCRMPSAGRDVASVKFRKAKILVFSLLEMPEGNI